MSIVVGFFISAKVFHQLPVCSQKIKKKLFVPLGAPPKGRCAEAVVFQGVDEVTGTSFTVQRMINQQPTFSFLS